MLKYLHHLSAFLFYVFGGVFFASYILLRNGMGGTLPLTILTKWDLSMMLVAMLYGGLSVYRSVGDDGHSRALAWMITVPLALAFAFFCLLNFWF